MEKTVYLHIGIGKTATSAIQKTLFTQRNELLNHNVFVPLTGLNYDNLGHHRLANFEENDFSERTKNFYAKLAEEMSISVKTNFLISSELFCYCKPAFVHSVASFFTTRGYTAKIIFFVREQIGLIESTYLWWQSQGYDYRYDIKKFLEMMEGGFNYLWLIKNWENEFGSENITVKIHDKKYFSNGLIEYFFQDIGLETDFKLEEQKENVNKSLLACYSDLISTIDQVGLQLQQNEQRYTALRKSMIESFVEISEKSINKEKAFQQVVRIVEWLHSELNYSDLQMQQINDSVNKMFVDFNPSMTLMTEAFKHHILEHYKSSNFTFAQKYLNEEAMDVFLKNYMRD